MAKRLCDWCVAKNDPQLGTIKVPGGAKEWACQRHAEEFWRGLVRTAAAIGERDRAVAAEIEDEFTEAGRVDATALRAADEARILLEIKGDVACWNGDC